MKSTRRYYFSSWSSNSNNIFILRDIYKRRSSDLGVCPFLTNSAEEPNTNTHCHWQQHKQLPRALTTAPSHTSYLIWVDNSFLSRVHGFLIAFFFSSWRSEDEPQEAKANRKLFVSASRDGKFTTFDFFFFFSPLYGRSGMVSPKVQVSGCYSKPGSKAQLRNETAI